MKYLFPALLACMLPSGTVLAADTPPASVAQRDMATNITAKPATAVSDASVKQTTALGEVVVSATRVSQPVLDTAASITVITAQEIDNTLAGDIGQMVRYQPGISVPNDPTRFGSRGFDIRGINGNRIKILLDGVPAPDAFSIGSLSDAGRNFVDPDVLKRVEIIRGPASSLYGSEAVGGVVNFITKDPGDYLLQGNGDAYFGTGTGWNSVDNSAMLSGTAAFGDADNQGMVLFTRRQGHEAGNQGSVDTEDATRTTPNPQNNQDNNLLAKGVFNREWGTLSLTLSNHHSDNDTQVFSALESTDYSAMVGFPYVLATTSMSGHDTSDLTLASARLDFKGAGSGWFDDGTALTYCQYGDTQQDTLERQRTTIFGAPNDALINRRFTFAQHTAGTSLTLRKRFGETVRHLLVYGLDVDRSRIEEMRDGWKQDLATGAITTTVGPDTFPARDFPLSTTLEAGLFAEDRMAFADERFLLIPGLRYDYYRLDADNDPVFGNTSPGIAAEDTTDSSWSPRLGAVYKLDDRSSLFAQYAYGFRAPDYSDVNVGFTNLQFGYTAIPNPNLKPETSNAVEFGIKHFGDGANFSLSAYYDRFDDFIEPFVSLGVDPNTNLLTFQAQNIGKVTLYGVEARATFKLDAVLQGLRLDSALAWGVGNDDAADAPLNSVNPPEAILGLGYLSASSLWGARLVGTFVHAKTRVNNDPAATQFQIPGYATFDLIGNFNLDDSTRIVVGLFNLTDRKYWNWSSVQGRPDGDPLIDRYTQPGFNVGASLHVSW
ncbi:MAG TPA: TonB-dependent hemoglobin/transferrin/lactoferrin family receptor [Gammaproteobacteria bacterium]|nr:TonB-dependent hemoglobin/transferrin/lactoferrin family receptor [Gammaproteobacteria bacterium]